MRRASSRLGWAATAATLLALSIPAAAGATPFSFTFDADAQGWQGTQGEDEPMFFDPWSGSAGNPGGGLTLTDTGAETCEMPTDPCETAAFLRSGLATSASNYGGTLSFDYKTSVEPTTEGVSIIITREGPGVYQDLFEYVLVSGTDYLTISRALTTGTFWEFEDYVNNVQEPNATMAQIQSVLSGPVDVWIKVDTVEGATGETYSVDDVTLTDGAPVSSGGGSPAGSPAPSVPVAPAAGPAPKKKSKKKCKKGYKLKKGKCVKKK